MRRAAAATITLPTVVVWRRLWRASSAIMVWRRRLTTTVVIGRRRMWLVEMHIDTAIHGGRNATRERHAGGVQRSLVAAFVRVRRRDETSWANCYPRRHTTWRRDTVGTGAIVRVAWWGEWRRVVDRRGTSAIAIIVRIYGRRWTATVTIVIRIHGRRRPSAIIVARRRTAAVVPAFAPSIVVRGWAIASRR